MADVRALLRQQRETRRISHPHAAYSDAGKLLCTLCREHIRIETQWDAHIQTASHKQKHRLLLASKSNASSGEESESSSATQKRKLGDSNDDNHQDVDMEEDDEARRKRTRPDPSTPTATATTTLGHRRSDSKNAHPGLLRRKSTTPSQGVEIQIPSRPTTPAHHRERSTSSSLTPQTSGPTTTLPSLPSRQPSNLAIPASDSQPNSTTPIPPTSAAPTPAFSTSTPTAPAPEIDEAEWAAFEADIAAASAPYDEDAVISRPAMTAEESAAAREAEAQDADGTRKTKADVDIEDEREEATRALEEEFEEMQSLEARVQRLKEKREALLRKKGEGSGLVPDSTASILTSGIEGGKEKVSMSINHDEDEGDEDDEDDDDWDGFRFKTGR